MHFKRMSALKCFRVQWSVADPSQEKTGPVIECGRRGVYTDNLGSVPTASELQSTEHMHTADNTHTHTPTHTLSEPF